MMTGNATERLVSPVQKSRVSRAERVEF